MNKFGDALKSIVPMVPILLVGGLVWFVLWARRQRRGVREFYGKHSLCLAEDAPQNIRAAIGVADPICFKGALNPISGGAVPFYWWVWYSRSTPVQGISCFLAISFPPNTVSEAFEQIAIREKDAKRNILKRLKYIYAVNTHQPTRTEKLPDGTFIVFWRVVLRPKVMEAKITWLKRYLSVPIQPSAANPPESKTVSAAATATPAAPSSPAKATFYKHDNYATMKQTFRTAWLNLRLELYEGGMKFYKECYDEFSDDKTFFAADEPNDVVMALTDQTVVRTALRLFKDRFKCEPMILCEGYDVENDRTLDHWNTLFKLPLNVFEYGEFKRRFSEHWTNLSIELYDASPDHGGLGRGAKELAVDFDMSSLAGVGSPLHDYISVATWGESLKGSSLSAAIKNEKLGIYCQGNWLGQRLPAFQWAETA